MKMRETMGRTGLRVGVLALCATAWSGLAVLGQDSSAPAGATQQQGGGPPMMGRMGPGMMQARQLEMMTKELDLTPEQVTKVKALQADTMEKMVALRGDQSVAAADRQSKMMAIRTESREKMRGLLTDEQKTKFDAMEAKMRARREQRGGDGPPPPPAPPQ